MAGYKYVSTDVITGAVLSDSLPLDVSSFSAALNGGGSFNGSLALSQDYAVNAPYLAALRPGACMLWALADGWPAWCGIGWDTPDSTRSRPVMPVSGQTLDSLWGKRLITDTLEYKDVDVFTVFTDLLQYGMTKQSPYLSPLTPAVMRPAAKLALFAAYGRVARLVLPDPTVRSGVTWSVSYQYSDETPVAQAWQDLCAATGLEYAFTPGLDANNQLAVYLRLGYTTLGRPYAQTGITLTYPGNLADYGYPVTRSQGANVVYGTAPPNGAGTQWESQWPHGADLADITAGNPVLEASASWQGSVVTSQDQVDGFADGQVAMRTAGMTLPTVVIPGGGWPTVKELILGDGAFLSLTSPRHPPQADGSAGLQQEVRITGWTVNPPGDQQAESTQVTTSAVVAS